MRRNQGWSMDFVSDSMATGQTVRVLTVVDDYTRECLAMESWSEQRGVRLNFIEPGKPGAGASSRTTPAAIPGDYARAMLCPVVSWS